MAWTTPRVWTDEELVTAQNMNTYISDNLSFLAGLVNGMTGQTKVSTSALSTTSTNYANIDGNNLAVTLFVHSPRVLVFLSSTITLGSANAFVTISNGITDLGTLATFTNSTLRLSTLGVFTGLSIGTSYTFVPQWKTSSSGVSLATVAPHLTTFAAMEI